MSKLVESFVTDAVNRIKTPEVQSVLQENVLSPLVAAILKYLAPYLVGILVVWTLMLGGIFLILWRQTGVGVK